MPPSGNRILLVEDDAGDAFLIDELLHEADAPVDLVIVPTLRKALPLVAEVAAVILDMGLPDANGLAGLEAIKRIDPGLPVVVLTGLDNEHLGVAAVEAGAEDFMIKGRVDGENLARSLRYAVERGKLQRELAELRAAQADARRTERRIRSGRMPDLEQSSCLLIGTSRYDDTVMYPDLPAVENNLHRLAAVLTDGDLGGFRPDRVHIEHNPSEAIGTRLADLSEQTKDTLVVYYAGHGVIDDDGELYLGLPTMRAGMAWCTALPYQWIRRAMLTTPAAARILILDCCFSGRAIDAMADAESGIGGQLAIGGAYTLTATTATKTARAPNGAPLTAFTGELLNLLENGLADAGPLLHITEWYSPLANALLAKNFPHPKQRGTDGIGDLALTRNAATFRSSRLSAPDSVDSVVVVPASSPSLSG